MSGRCRTLLYHPAVLSLHARIALLTLLPVLLWASRHFVAQLRTEDALQGPLPIGIEHDGNAAVTLTQTRNRRPQMIDVANDGSGTIRISAPAEWERGEVRGAALADLIVEAPMFGYRRWHIPAGATLSFRNPLPPRDWVIHNPSGLAMRLRVVRVDLATEQVTREVHLMSDQSLTVP